jgi:hypothetical protein
LRRPCGYFIDDAADLDADRAERMMRSAGPRLGGRERWIAELTIGYTASGKRVVRKAG